MQSVLHAELRLGNRMIHATVLRAKVELMLHHARTWSFTAMATAIRTLSIQTSTLVKYSEVHAQYATDYAFFLRRCGLGPFLGSSWSEKEVLHGVERLFKASEPAVIS